MFICTSNVQYIEDYCCVRLGLLCARYAGLNVHVRMWFSSRYIAEVSLAISYNKKHATYKFQWTIKNLHAQRHVLS